MNGQIISHRREKNGREIIAIDNNQVDNER